MIEIRIPHSLYTPKMLTATVFEVMYKNTSNRYVPLSLKIFQDMYLRSVNTKRENG
jgi:hypothetical protein